MSKVKQVKQSPSNEKRWLIILSCGHERWVTKATKPTRKNMMCVHCDAHSNPPEKNYRATA